MNLKDYVPAFVKAYYTNILDSPRDVKKFYSTDATYYRPYMNLNSAEPINPDQVCPRIAQTSVLTIKNFVSAPIPRTSSISVSVNGNYTSPKKSSSFNQYFILQEIGGRICIVSDIYNEFDGTNLSSEPQTSSQATTTETTTTTTPAAATTTPPPPATTTNTEPNANTNYNRNTNQSQRGRRNKKKNQFVYVPE